VLGAGSSTFILNFLSFSHPLDQGDGCFPHLFLKIRKWGCREKRLSAYGKSLCSRCGAGVLLTSLPLAVHSGIGWWLLWPSMVSIFFGQPNCSGSSMQGHCPFSLTCLLIFTLSCTWLILLCCDPDSGSCSMRDVQAALLCWCLIHPVGCDENSSEPWTAWAGIPYSLHFSLTFGLLRNFIVDFLST
jgi:hypothetical protein